MEGLLAVGTALIIFSCVFITEEQLEKKNIEDNLNEE
jgi:hypothetical protein